MQVVPLPFDEWLPDRADHDNPGLVVAENVIPTPRGYAPFQDKNTSLLSLSTDRPFAAKGDGRNKAVVLTQFNARLLSRNSVGVWSSVATQANSGAIPLGNPPIGAIVQWDDDIFIAAFSEASIYSIDTSAGTPSWSAISTPAAFGTMARAGNFLLGARGQGDSLLYWSAFNDYTDFTAAQRTQAGSAQLDTAELGAITCITSGEQPLVFQERGVTRLDYVGPPRVWVDRLISAQFGCVGPLAAVSVHNRVYFMSALGFCVTNGAEVVPLGSGIVDKYMEGLLNAYGSNYVRVSYDVKRRLVIISFPSLSGNYTVYEDHVIYSERTGTFSELSGSYEAFFSFPELNGKRYDLYAFAENSSNFDLYQMSGDNLAATMTTGHKTPVPGARAVVNSFEPVYTGSGATCAISTKQTINGAATVSAYASQETTGLCHAPGDGRSFAVSVQFAAAADWDEFRGVYVEGDNVGKR